eukprot:Clim_evm46s251 gene=Clim_evmTU46s251
MAADADEVRAWRYYKYTDPGSGQEYYYDAATAETQWTKPDGYDDMTVTGPPPTDDTQENTVDAVDKLSKQATGTSRGNENEEAKNFTKDPPKISFDKPARTQAAKGQARKQGVDGSTTHHKPQGPHDYNIWYNTFVGNDKNRRVGLALTRCNPERDEGWTRADRTDPDCQRTFFCLHFARGCCIQGSRCTYRHHVPREWECEILGQNLARDCFGRSRHNDHRADGYGVGSFTSESHALYVTGMGEAAVETMSALLEREFSIFGTVERVHYRQGKSFAFVHYKHRTNAEFAKQALADQLMDGRYHLTLRWATEQTKWKASATTAKRKLLQAAEQKGLLPEQTEKGDDGHGDLKKAKRKR